MVESWILIDQADGDKEKLRSLSLQNAKQLVVGSVSGQVILHVAASSPGDLNSALVAFAKVSGVTNVVALTVRKTN